MGQRANQLLSIAGVGLLITYPFHYYGYGIGSFFMHVFAAALIGGIADWYGVTLLFKGPFAYLLEKPSTFLFKKTLTFPWEKPIIEHRREGLIEVVKHMIGQELLTEETIYKHLKEERPVGVLLTYARTEEGRRAVKDLLETVMEPLFRRRILEEGAEHLMERVKDALSSKDVTPYVVTFLRLIGQKTYCEPLWLYVNRLLQGFIGSEKIRPHLTGLLERTLEEYKKDNELRQLVDALREIFVSMDELSLLIQEKGKAYLEKRESLSSSPGRSFQSFIEGLGDTLEKEPAWQALLNKKKNDMVAQSLLYSPSFIDAEALEQKVIETVNTWIDDAHEAYYERGEMLPIEDEIWKALKRISPALSRWAQEAAETELKAYEGRQIAALLEDKVSRDIQGIRITGTLIGGVLGGSFFLLWHLLKEVIR